jgi:pimeloyl-ACP methyl ester carboxylesterase
MAQPESPTRAKGFFFLARRVLLVSAAAVIALLATGAIYHILATELDRRKFPPPGQLLDVGGYKMHAYCTGTGSPTVVLDSASLDTVSAWHWVQTAITGATRVCAYDRPGLGWSDLGPEPRDAKQNAKQLHTLLDVSDVEGPYVLVGHSFGGLYVRSYSAQYPDEVAGIVLVEGTHPDFLSRLGQPEVMPNADEGMLSTAPAAARLGLFRLITFIPTDPLLPAQQQGELAAYYASTKFADQVLSVYRQFPNLLAQARSVRDLNDVPLMVIIGSASENSTGVSHELQRDLLTLSSYSQLRVVSAATHMSLVHDPDHARQTSAAILEVVKAVRTGQW